MARLSIGRTPDQNTITDTDQRRKAKDALTTLSDRLDTAQTALDALTDDAAWDALTALQKLDRLRQGLAIVLRLAISAGRVALYAGRWILRR